MANCGEMKKGDVYVCTNCGLELQVIKQCICLLSSEKTCTVPLECCNKEMTKK